MIRAAAKNHGSVGVVTDPGQYAPVLDELRAGGARSSDATRCAPRARKRSARTAQYDAAIAAYLRSPATARRRPSVSPTSSRIRFVCEAERAS